MFKTVICIIVSLTLFVSQSHAKSLEINLHRVIFSSQEVAINGLFIFENLNMSIGPMYEIRKGTLVTGGQEYNNITTKSGVRAQWYSKPMDQNSGYFAVEAYSFSLSDQFCEPATNLKADLLVGYGFKYKSGFALNFGLGQSFNLNENDNFDCGPYDSLNWNWFNAIKSPIAMDVSLGYSL